MRDGMQLLRRLTVAVCAGALSLCASAESAAVEGVPKDRPLKVLMIGNSFSLSNFRQMPKVAAAMGRRLDLASIHIGGCSLERHWNNVLAASTNATFRPYKLDRDVEGRRTARDVMVNMPDALVLDKWDVVTIQQASSLSWRSETYQPFGDLLVAKIREFAPQAKIVVQETWSYPPWDKRLANFGFGPEEMYRRLHDAYGAFAKKHGFDVVPVGAAAERFPNRESLFTKPDFHFNRDGEYLQGLVFTAKLFGADVRKCAYKPDWMDASRAEEMKSVAMAAIEGQRRFMLVDFKSSQTNKHRSAEVVAFPDAPFEMPAIAVPQFAERDFSIADFGAKEGVKSTEAFAKAMATCEAAGGGRVVVPKGTWLTGAVHFRNNCNLHLADGATLEFTDDPADYLPVVHTSWEGVECLNYSPLLYGYGVTNVAITGKGTIAPRMDFWKTWFPRPPEHMKATEMLYHWCSTNAVMSARDLTAIKGSNVRPHLIQFNRCGNVLLDGFRIRESPFWTIHLYHSENCVVRNLDVYAHGHNNDGVDIEMTRNVLVGNCRFDQGDDGIVLKAGRNQDAWRLNRPTENIVVRN